MKQKLLLILVIFLAIVLRFYHLGSNPPSLDWDEASLGYNAYSLLKTGGDEYGFKLPLSIRSFNDYKPPLYTYLSILPVALLGLTEYAVRLPSAIVAVLAVIFTYFLVTELFKNNKIALLSTFFLAISPWHVQFSRIAFEANIALTLVIIAVYFFLRGIENFRGLPVSAFFFGLALYAYHSPRLIIPFIVLGLICIYFSLLKSNLKYLAVFLSILAVFYLPILREFGQSTAARFSSVSAINANEKLGSSIKDQQYDLKKGIPFANILHNRRIVFGREILAGYLDHFNFDFLFLTGDSPGRHHAADQGMLYFVEIPLVLIGFLILITSFKNPSSKTVLLWFLLAPLAASLTSGTPHAVRAIFYLPTYQIFTSLAVLSLIKKQNIYIFTLSSLFFINFFYYLHQYYVHTPVEYAREWQFGYKEAVKIADFYRGSVDKIIVTYQYDQPYIYFLFYDKIDPRWYQQNWLGDLSSNPEAEIKRSERRFGIYEFRNIEWEKDKELRRILLIGTPQDFPGNVGGKVADIAFPDGEIAFRIVKR